MAKKLILECGSLGPVCGAKVTGETEDEVLAKAVEHAQKVHGVDVTQAKTLVRYAQTRVREAS